MNMWDDRMVVRNSCLKCLYDLDDDNIILTDIVMNIEANMFSMLLYK
jgi:hypothetical protein